LVTSGYFAKVLFCIFTQSPPIAEYYGGEFLSQQLLGRTLGFCRVCAEDFAYANPNFERHAAEGVTRKQQAMLVVY